MKECDKQFKEHALNWLREQQRNEEDIANKMLQISQVSIRIAEEHYTKNSVSEFMAKAIGEILKPPSS